MVRIHGKVTARATLKIIRVGTGLLLITSAVFKLLTFFPNVLYFGVDSVWNGFALLLLSLVELLVGSSLAVGFGWTGFAMSSVLFGVFAVYHLIGLAIGTKYGCDCFGSALHPSHGAMLAGNLFLCMLTLLAAFLSRSEPGTSDWSGVRAASAILTATILIVWFRSMPIASELGVVERVRYSPTLARTGTGGDGRLTADLLAHNSSSTDIQLLSMGRGCSCRAAQLPLTIPAGQTIRIPMILSVDPQVTAQELVGVFWLAFDGQLHRGPWRSTYRYD